MHDMHTLSSEEAARRWEDELSAAERRELVAEAADDLGLNPADRPPLAMTGYELGNCIMRRPYARAVRSFNEGVYPGLFGEVHRRLAGGARHHRT